jgi:hypothetical protein
MDTVYDDLEDLIEIRTEELAEEKFGVGYADLSADDRTWIRSLAVHDVVRPED